MAGTIVVATTTDAADNEIEGICKREKIRCFRGDAYDLLDRHYKAALQYGADVVLKIPSDCPLIDPAIIDKVITFFLDGKGCFDYVSNLHPATYPDGNDVEVMSFKALETAWQLADKKMELEHTTPFIWEHPDSFSIGNVTMEDAADYSMTHRFTIDYTEDYLFINTVYEKLFPVNKSFSLNDILNLLNHHPEIYGINKHLAGVNWYRHHLDELKTISTAQTKLLAS